MRRLTSAASALTASTHSGGTLPLSVRRHVDHTVQFKTDPKQLGLEPGAIINIATTSSPESSTVNGVVNADDGGILCTDEFADGTYEVSMYVPAREELRSFSLR